MSRPRFVLATANPGKAAEILEILGDAYELVPRPADLPDVEEHGDTLEENARLKAVALVEATGQPALADDTGLEIEALGGAPGVHTARWGGQGYERALAELAGRPWPERRARFRTVALARFPDGREVVATGVVEGHLAEAPRGEGGFGYDPVFVPDDGDGRTFAEMTAEEKHARSHRGRAFRALAAALRQG